MKNKTIQKEQRLHLIYSPGSFSSSDMQTLPTTLREKKVHSFPLLNSTYASPIYRDSKLQLVKGRKNKATELTPQIISEIIKHYFIPIFDAQRIRKKNLVTPKSQEFPQSLSEIFETQLKESELNLARLKTRLSEIEKDKESKIKEIKSVQEKILINKVNLEVGKVRCDPIIKDSHFLALKRYEELYECSQKKKEKESKNLHSERIQNSTLDDKANKLDHFHSLFKMRSEIMGESLKGLFFASSKLNTQHLCSVFGKTINTISNRSVYLQTLELKTHKKIQILTINIQKTSDKSLAKLSERTNYQRDSRNWLMKYNYEKDLFSNEYRKSHDEKEANISRFFDLQKKSTVLEDEFGKMQKRLKDINSKNKLSDYDEKICKFCRQYFIEKENYNWSCCVHTSEFSDSQFYYCCGANFKDAPGCRKSKHVPESSEKRMIQTNSNNSKVKCTNCGETGHYFKDCEKDPNPKNSSQLIYRPLRKQNKIKIRMIPKIKEEEEDYSEFSDIEIEKKIIEKSFQM